MSDGLKSGRPDAKRVVVFGASAVGERGWGEALGVGREIGKRGWVLVNGGYGGVMEASAKGAREAGGWVIGVTCGIFGSAPNGYLNEIIEKRDLLDRLRTLIELGDAYVVLPGSTGTLVELALAWEMVNKRLVPERPILCWGESWRGVIETFAQDASADPHVPTPWPHDRRGELVRTVHSADEVGGMLAFRLGSRNEL